MSESRRYLVTTFEGGGNVPVVLGVVARLVAAGHRVDVLTEPCLREAVEQTGAAFRPFGEYFTREDRRIDMVQDAFAKNPMDAFKRSFSRVVLGPAAIVADETARLLRTGSYDAVVADLMMPGALVAAEAANLPRVIINHTAEMLPGPGRPAPGFMPRADWIGRLRDRLFAALFRRLLAGFLDDFNAVRVRHGLAPVEGFEQQIHGADRRLVMTSRDFDFPLDPPPENVRYVGPVLDDPDWTATGWKNPWPDSDARPLVVVAMSSTFQNQAAILQRTIAALGMLDVRGLVTLGPAMEDQRFEIPANVVVVPGVPHSVVFPEAAAIVTHAGLGTVTRGLVHGVPLLCLPMGRDQDDNAVRVVWRGAGLRLKRSAGRRQIARAVRTLLDEPAYRDHAARLGETLRRDAMSGAAVRELEDVVEERRAAVPAGR